MNLDDILPANFSERIAEIGETTATAEEAAAAFADLLMGDLMDIMPPEVAEDLRREIAGRVLKASKSEAP